MGRSVVRSLRLRLSRSPAGGIGRAVRLGNENERRFRLVGTPIGLANGIAAIGDPE
jgi:hypothetical protein